MDSVDKFIFFLVLIIIFLFLASCGMLLVQIWREINKRKQTQYSIGDEPKGED